KTGQTGSAKDTSQVEVSAKGGGKGGNGGNSKPKQETTTLGEISALAALKTSTNTPVEAYLEMQANQRQVDFDESFKALVSASKRKAIVPAYLVKPNDPLFYTTALWSRIRQGNDTCFVASKFTAKELVQVGLIYVHVQFLAPSGLPVNEVCIPVKLPASSALQPTSSVLGLALDVQKAVLNSDELKGQQIGTKLFVSERPKPYSLIMPYLTEDIGLFMVSTESGVVLSFSEVPMAESLQQLVLEGFKQSLTLKK
ncbi:MAG: hypothetical protein L6Q78_09965, partial [Bacteroidia bacterium]|nr:hypothetical protein [Bacteroidia bacterium]